MPSTMRDQVLPKSVVLKTSGVKSLNLYLRGRHVGGRRTMGRHLDGIDHRLSHVGRGHVAPRLARVARQLHQTVVGAHPQRAGVLRGLGDVVDHAVGLAAGTLVGNRRPARPLLALVVARKVGADLAPRLAAVVGAQQHVAAVVDDRRVVARDHDGRAPVEAVLLIARRHRGRHLRPGHDVTGRLRVVVELADDPHVAAGVDVARACLGRTRHGTLAAADDRTSPVGIPPCMALAIVTTSCPAGPHRRRTGTVAHVHPVELRGGLIRLR